MHFPRKTSSFWTTYWRLVRRISQRGYITDIDCRYASLLLDDAARLFATDGPRRGHEVDDAMLVLEGIEAYGHQAFLARLKAYQAEARLGS